MLQQQLLGAVELPEEVVDHAPIRQEASDDGLQLATAHVVRHLLAADEVMEQLHTPEQPG